MSRKYKYQTIKVLFRNSQKQQEIPAADYSVNMLYSCLQDLNIRSVKIEDSTVSFPAIFYNEFGIATVRSNWLMDFTVIDDYVALMETFVRKTKVLNELSLSSSIGLALYCYPPITATNGNMPKNRVMKIEKPNDTTFILSSVDISDGGKYFFS